MAKRLKVEQVEFIPSGGPSRTQTHHADDLDMNKVIARIRRGAMPPAVRHPIFMEVVSEDYLEMVNYVRDAQEEFMRLPSKLRSRFANDPYQLIRFLEKEENREEAINLGFVAPEAETGRPVGGTPGAKPPSDGDGTVHKAPDKSGVPASPNRTDPEAQPRKGS